MGDPVDEIGEPVPRALAHLIGSGDLAVVLLDENLITRERQGELVSAVPLGIVIDEGLPYLAGLAPDLLNLQDEPEATFLLSNVGISGGDKVNVEAFWQAEDRRYCLLIHRLGLRTAPEAEIVKQIKSRRIAEQHLQQTRQALAEQTALTDILAEAAPLALAVVDRERRYLFATRAWHELFALGPDPVAGRMLADTIAMPEELERRALAPGLGGQRIADCELAYVIAGRTHQIRLSVAPWRRGGGSVQGVLILASGIDREHVQAERILRLERNVGALEEIIAIAAHDLEAPRRAIERAIEQQGDLGREEIAAQSERQRTLLAQLLEHARLAGMPAAQEVVDLAAAAEAALSTCPGRDEFRLACHPADMRVTALRLPLETILRNLIANAVRHHDRGHGLIEIGLDELSEGWRLTVCDDGPGIPSADRAHIFEAFRQLDAGGPRGGHGLGLFLVASAARRLGGTITANEREKGTRGACFTLVWPKG